MIEHGAMWSLTTSNGNAVLNFYKENAENKGVPYIVYLSELINVNKIAANYSAKLLDTLNNMGQQNLLGINSQWSPLMLSVSQRKIEIVKILLENGADVNFSDSNGFTPLMLSAILNDVKIMQVLIQYGANVNARSKNSFSAIIYADYL